MSDEWVDPVLRLPNSRSSTLSKNGTSSLVLNTNKKKLGAFSLSLFLPEIC